MKSANKMKLTYGMPKLHGLQCSQILHKIISTQLLTWLIIGVILQLEQRRGHKEIRKEVPNRSS